MADNTTLNSGSGGDTLRTEDRTTYKTPVSIIDVGGTASEKLLGDASVVFPLANTVKDASGTFYAPLVDADGHLQVDALSAVVTNAGTFAVQESGAALTALQLIDDAVYTDGTGTPSKGLAVMGTDGTNPQIISTNTTGHVNIADGGNVISVDWNGTAPPVGAGVEATALRVTVATDSTGVLSVDDNGGSLTVDNAALSVTGGGLEASALRVTLASDSTGVLSVDDNGGSITVDNAALSVTGGGVEASALRVTIASDSTGVLTVDDGGSTISIDDGAGSITVDGSLTSVTTVSTVTAVTTVSTVTTCGTVTTLTGGGVAHDGVDSGNPHKVGARASTAQSGLTLVADADRTDLLASSDGSLYVRDICLEDVVQDRATNTDGASTAFTGGLAAPGAGVRLWVKKVTISNSSASFCTVDLRDGAAGAVLWTLPVPATGGITERFDPPLKLTANTALAYDASAATTTLTISANGFKSKV